MHLVTKALGIVALCGAFLGPAAAQSTAVPLPPHKSSAGETPRQCGSGCEKQCETRERAAYAACQPTFASCMKACDRDKSTCEMDCRDRVEHCEGKPREDAKVCRQTCKC